jgi:hypothetical protein
MTLLSEFPQQVIASHALVAAEILSGESPSADTLLELAAEAITVDRLTVLMARQAGTIQLARDCWQAACECFEQSYELWNRLPSGDGLLAGHRRLLERLIRSAQERREFYTVTAEDRLRYNSQRDHSMPCALL